MRPHNLCAMLVALLSLSASEAFAQRPTASLQIITTFSYPSARARDTTATAISNDGSVTGSFNSSGMTYGFVRTADGKFSPPISHPPVKEVLPGGINTSGMVSGYSLDTTVGLHGFLYQNGVYTPYDVPGSVNTLVTGINDQGSFVGLYVPPGSNTTIGFVNMGGTITTVLPLDATYTQPRAINNRNQVVGFYQNGTGIDYGFFRDANGVSTGPLEFAGSDGTQALAINDRGTIVGIYFDALGLYHGFLLQGLTQFTGIDVPGAVITAITGINNSGLVCGYYTMPDNSFTAFIGRIR